MEMAVWCGGGFISSLIDWCYQSCRFKHVLKPEYSLLKESLLFWLSWEILQSVDGI